VHGARLPVAVGRARYLLVAFVVAFAACGDDDSGPDVGAIERDLAVGVEQDTGTNDVSVDCPEDVGEGDVCQVTAAGGVHAQIRVTQLDDQVEGELVQP
jgi:hypothetical protein